MYIFVTHVIGGPPAVRFPLQLNAYIISGLLPVEQWVDDDIKIMVSDRDHLRLPKQFLIYSHECDCPFPVEAIGETQNGIWTETRLITADNAAQKPEETREQFKKRLHWLQEGSRKKIN